jgi:hypothetical protein
VLKWFFKNELIIQQTCVEMAKVLWHSSKRKLCREIFSNDEGSSNNTLKLLKPQHVIKKRVSSPCPHERFVNTSMTTQKHLLTTEGK